MLNHRAGQETLREPGRVQVHGGIVQVREIRSSVYEDVNQIQHEYLLLRGLEWQDSLSFAPARERS
jgi:hypothetical protein